MCSQLEDMWLGERKAELLGGLFLDMLLIHSVVEIKYKFALGLSSPL